MCSLLSENRSNVMQTSVRLLCSQADGSHFLHHEPEYRVHVTFSPWPIKILSRPVDTPKAAGPRTRACIVFTVVLWHSRHCLNRVLWQQVAAVTCPQDAMLAKLQNDLCYFRKKPTLCRQHKPAGQIAGQGPERSVPIRGYDSISLAHLKTKKREVTGKPHVRVLYFSGRIPYMWIGPKRLNLTKIGKQ